MRRLWIVVALLLSACAASTETPIPTDTPSPTQPPPTPTPTSTVMPSPEPTETPSGLAALMIDANQVQFEVGHLVSDMPVDIRSELVESGLCSIDCAGARFASVDGMYDFVVTMIAFEDEQGAAALIAALFQDAIANGATAIDFQAEGLDVQYLPDGSHIVYLDKTWSVFAQQGNIFVGAEIILYAEIDGPMPHGELMSFSVATAFLAASQIEALAEAGY